MLSFVIFENTGSAGETGKDLEFQPADSEQLTVYSQLKPIQQIVSGNPIMAYLVILNTEFWHPHYLIDHRLRKASGMQGVIAHICLAGCRQSGHHIVREISGLIWTGKS